MELQASFQARVSFASQERYRIVGADHFECEAIPAGSLRWDGSLPAVGDVVEARLTGPALAVIETIRPRGAVISRRGPGRSGERQILAANIDVVIMVTALDRDFNVRRLERYLVLAAECGAATVIALNKAELCADLPAAFQAVAGIAPGAACVALSAIESAEPLRAHIGQGTAILLGSSGVGKSTIANALLGQTRQATEAVREHDARGRHTTTHRMLLPLPAGGWLIDTPGLRELGLWAGQSALDDVFGDIASAAEGCRFRDCTHANEPGCAVAVALEHGLIDASRWASYLKLQAEVRHVTRATNREAAATEKQRGKTIHKAMRRHPKRRGEGQA